MRKQVRWFLVILVLIALGASARGALGLGGRPDPVLTAEFVGTSLRVQLTNQGTGWLKYRQAGYAESASDLREDHWSVQIMNEDGTDRRRLGICGTGLVVGWAWLGPGKSVSKELDYDFYRAEFGEPDQPARAEATVMIGLSEQIVHSELVKFSPKEFKPDLEQIKPDLEQINLEFEARLEELRNSAASKRD